MCDIVLDNSYCCANMRHMSLPSDNVMARIRQYRKTAGITRFRFACLAGVPEGSVRNIDDPSWNPTFATFRSLDAVVPEDFVLGQVTAERKVKKKLTIGPLSHGAVHSQTESLK